MTDAQLSTRPLLATIVLTGLVLATVIAGQATGVPIVALLLVPWLLLMFALVLPRSAPVGQEASMPSPVRRLTVAAGLATVVVGAALATAGDWSGAGDAEPTATAALAAVAESPAVADQDGEAVAHATTGPGAQ